MSFGLKVVSYDSNRATKSSGDGVFEGGGNVVQVNIQATHQLGSFSSIKEALMGALFQRNT